MRKLIKFGDHKLQLYQKRTIHFFEIWTIDFEISTLRKFVKFKYEIKIIHKILIHNPIMFTKSISRIGITFFWIHRIQYFSFHLIHPKCIDKIFVYIKNWTGVHLNIDFKDSILVIFLSFVIWIFKLHQNVTNFNCEWIQIFSIFRIHSQCCARLKPVYNLISFYWRSN